MHDGKDEKQKKVRLEEEEVPVFEFPFPFLEERNGVFGPVQTVFKPI